MSIFRVFGSMAVIWTVNDYFYIAGSLNAENLAGNIFTNFSLLSLTELPSVFIGQFLMGLWHTTSSILCRIILRALKIASGGGGFTACAWCWPRPRWCCPSCSSAPTTTSWWGSPSYPRWPATSAGSSCGSSVWRRGGKIEDYWPLTFLFIDISNVPPEYWDNNCLSRGSAWRNDGAIRSWFGENSQFESWIF